MGWWKNRKLKKIRDKFLLEYTAYLAGSGWGPLFDEVIKRDRGIWDRDTSFYEKIRQILNIDNPFAAFKESAAKISGLNPENNEVLRKMVEANLTDNTIESLSNRAFGMPNLLMINTKEWQYKSRQGGPFWPTNKMIMDTFDKVSEL